MSSRPTGRRPEAEGRGRARWPEGRLRPTEGRNLARKLPAVLVAVEQRRAPGQCVDCESDAFIRLASDDGSDRMVCGHCYAERLSRLRSRSAPQRAALADAP